VVFVIRLLLVDDHALFREGMRALLKTETDMEVAATASDGREALRAAEETSADVAVLDVGLPGSNGIALLRDLTRVAPKTRSLMLSMHTAHEFVRQAFGAGACGYALKDQPPEQVAEAIRSVAHGGRYLAPRLPRTLLEPPSAGAAEGPLATLSAREREIFDLAVRGFTNVSIGATLCISVKTVETHRAHINRKLGVHSASELIRFAARHGLVCE
jgi:DNA-binding NarL/FixJ family response regulator